MHYVEEQKKITILYTIPLNYYTILHRSLIWLQSIETRLCRFLIIFISPIMVVQIQPNNQNKIQILN